MLNKIINLQGIYILGIFHSAGFRPVQINKNVGLIVFYRCKNQFFIAGGSVLHNRIERTVRQFYSNLFHNTLGFLKNSDACITNQYS